MSKEKEKRFESRKFKYGTVAVLFTVAVIVAVLVLNVVISALSQRFSLYVDLTSKDIYSVSKACSDLIDNLIDSHKDDPEPLHYEIKFCAAADELNASSETKMVYEFTLRLKAKYPDLISISHLDIITHPTLVEKYKTTAADSVKTTDVIVESSTGFRKYAIAAFYVFAESDNSVFAFNAEMKFTSAFLQLAGEYNPRAVFLTGHGEADATPLASLFDAAGFDVFLMDLQTGFSDGTMQIEPGRLPDNTKVVVIMNPKFDYIGYNSDGLVNEIAVLDDFLEIRDDGSAGNLMLFLSPENAGKLPELESYLTEWGVQFGQAILKDTASSSSVDSQTIIATLPEEGVGASLHTSLRELSSVPLTIVKNAGPIYQLWELNGTRNVSSVLTTTKTAEAYPSDGEGDPVRGQFDLMTLIRDRRYINNRSCYASVLVCSSANFADSAYMAQRQYGNSDILYSAMRLLFGIDNVPIDIDFKVFDDIGLSISTEQADGWTVFLCAVVPVAMLILGTVVFIRRKHL
ncbi:MAG: Gldg family protein [Clostridia bacterium]|nr:Gldg family protein [Clostridia bacterium]